MNYIDSDVEKFYLQVFDWDSLVLEVVRKGLRWSTQDQFRNTLLIE